MANPGKTLTVYLAANTSGMTRGVNQANRSLQSFGSGIGGAVGLTAGFGAALGMAAIQAGQFAFQLGAEGVKAALEDEKSLSMLNTTLSNMGFAAASTEVDNFISSLQSTVGVSEDELRPAMAALVRTTGDVQKSQELLRLALDISAGSGKNVSTVVAALQKAYDGNLGSLKRLGLGIDENILKSGDMDAITKALAGTFAGQASTAANTLEGKMKRLGLAGDEVKESFGKGFLTGLENAAGGIQGLQKTVEDMTGVAFTLGRYIGGALVGSFNFAMAAVQSFTYNSALLDKAWISVLDTLGIIPDAEAQVRMAAADANAALALQSGEAYLNASKLAWMSTTTDTAAASTSSYAGVLGALNVTLKDNTDTTDTNTTSVTNHTSALDAGRTKLQAMTEDVKSATREYQSLIQERDRLAGQFKQGITSGINLTSVFNPADAAAAQGAYVQQITDAQTFSEGLANLGSQLPATPGAQQFLQDIADLGASSGNSFLASLSPEVANNIVATLDAAATAINGNTSLMANKFYEEGLIGGAETLRGLNEQLTKSEQALIKLGKRIGEPIGAKIRDEIADAIEAAIAAAARGGVNIGITSAGIRRSAGITTETDVANGIGRIVARYDARSGYATPAPLA